MRRKERRGEERRERIPDPPLVSFRLSPSAFPLVHYPVTRKLLLKKQRKSKGEM
jgi:hypothetical protein